MLALGLIRIHEQRCPVLLEAMEGWEWDVPSGLRIEQVNRESIKWKKNGFSHFCEAAWYTVMAAISYHQPRIREHRSDEDLRSFLSNDESFLGLFSGDVYGSSDPLW